MLTYLLIIISVALSGLPGLRQSLFSLKSFPILLRATSVYFVVMYLCGLCAVYRHHTCFLLNAKDDTTYALEVLYTLG